MATHLSRHFEQQRLAKRLKPGQLSALIGRQNISKGGSRIRQFELTGEVAQSLFDKLAEALEVDSSTIQQLIEQDQREFIDAWLKWVSEQIAPYLTIKLMPAVYCRRNLPSHITSMEQAEDWVSEAAKEARKKCCLVWNRRISTWFDADGKLSFRTEAVPDEANCPWTKLGNGKAFQFGAELGSIKSIDVGPKPPGVEPPSQ